MDNDVLWSPKTSAFAARQTRAIAGSIDDELVREVTGHKSIVTDGFWIITFGQRGLVGVVAVFGWMLVPAAMAIWIVSRRGVPGSIAYPVIGLALWSSLYAADLLLNGFVSTVQGFVAGSLTSFIVLYRVSASSRAAGGYESQNASRRQHSVELTPRRSLLKTTSGGGRL